MSSQLPSALADGQQDQIKFQGFSPNSGLADQQTRRPTDSQTCRLLGIARFARDPQKRDPTKQTISGKRRFDF